MFLKVYSERKDCLGIIFMRSCLGIIFMRYFYFLLKFRKYIWILGCLFIWFLMDYCKVYFKICNLIIYMYFLFLF